MIGKKNEHIKISKTVLYGIGTFFISLIMMLSIMYFTNITPFGDKSFFSSDMHSQYSAFLAYLKTVFEGSNDLFYSLSKNIGDEIFGLSAYYLFSPFNYILVFFDMSELPTAISLIIMSKIIVSCISAYIFFSYKYKNGLPSLICALCYGFMSYSSTFAISLMWLDGVLILPLVVLGLERMHKLRRISLTYIISLSYAMITNYYIGYMICIFSLIYMLCLLFSANEIVNPKRGAITRLGIFLCSSIMSAGISAFVVIPVLYSLEGGKAIKPDFLSYEYVYTGLFIVGVILSIIFWSLTFSAKVREKNSKKIILFYGILASLSTSVAVFAYINLLKTTAFDGLLSNLFATTSGAAQIMQGYPSIYCGMVALLLLITFFTSKGIQVKERVAQGLLLGILLLSTSLYTLNNVWHGFNEPVWFPYRYAFIISFVIINIACKALTTSTDDNDKGNAKQKIIVSSGLILTVVCCIVMPKLQASFGNMTLINVCVAIIYTVLLFISCFNKIKRIALSLVLVIVSFELMLNATVTLNGITSWYGDDNLVSNYNSYLAKMEPVISEIKNSDNQLYRIEKNVMRSYNDAFMFDFNSITHYSSSSNTSTHDFLGTIGQSNDWVWSFYSEKSTSAFDSLFSIKYFVSSYKTHKKFDLYSENENLQTYLNPLALPIAFVSAENITTLGLSENSPFQNLNNIFKASSGLAESIFIPIEHEMSTTNLSMEKVDASHILYTKVDSENSAYIDYSFEVPTDDDLFVYFHSPIEQEQVANLSIIHNEREWPLGEYFTSYNKNALYVGTYAAGEKITIRLSLRDNTLSISSYDLVYEDYGTLSRHVALINQNKTDIREVTSSSYEGVAYSYDENSYLTFSIPYDEAWEVNVNGEKMKAEKAAGFLLAVPLNEGENEVKIEYKLKGQITANIISLSCIIITIGLYYFSRFHFKKIKQKNSLS